MNVRFLRIPLILALVASLSLVAGCSRNRKPDDSTPPVVEPTKTPDGSQGEEPRPVVAYFVGSEKVLPVRRESKTSGVAKESLAALLEGPTATESQSGLSSLIPAGTKLLAVSVGADGVATVNLSGEFTSGGGSLSMMGRVAQVVFTATQFSTIKSVQFQVDGTPLTVLGGEGIILDKPQTRADWEDFAPAILVESPVRGDSHQVSEPLVVIGSANVFEAQFDLEVVDGAGAVVGSQSVMATSGTGTRGTFEAAVVLPGNTRVGTGSIIVSYASPKDGAKVVVDEIPLVLK